MSRLVPGSLSFFLILLILSSLSHADSRQSFPISASESLTERGPERADRALPAHDGAPPVFDSTGGESATALPDQTQLHPGRSRSILDSCWTESDLAGKPDEKYPAKMPPGMLHDPSLGVLPSFGVIPVTSEFRGSIRSVSLSGGRKAVALTFDLCETSREIAGYDGDVIDYLRRNGVRATLFVGGKWMSSHPERMMQLMADPLFEIGSHSWTHANFRTLDAAEMERQILNTQAQYALLERELNNRECAIKEGGAHSGVPAAPTLFRFPFGTCNPEALSVLARSGLKAIQWSIVTGDPDRSRSGEAIAGTILREVKPGAIIICHANGRGHGTASALPRFIPKLRGEGYELVTVTELLSLGSPVISGECYETRPGDNRRYDRLRVSRQQLKMREGLY